MPIATFAAVVGFAGTAAAAGSDIAGAKLEAKAQRKNAKALREQGFFRKQGFEFNSKIARVQARDAIKRGGEEASRVRKLGRKTIGSQRAAFAAQGVEIDSGSALLVQEDTARITELDAIQVTNNAAREAFGFEVQAINFDKQGALAQLAAQNAATAAEDLADLTILGGFGSAAGRVGGFAGDLIPLLGRS